MSKLFTTFGESGNHRNDNTLNEGYFFKWRNKCLWSRDRRFACRGTANHSQNGNSMNKFVTRCLKRLLPLGLAASAAAAMLVPAAANATPYVVTLRQQGGNVVATGSGEFDLTGLELYSAGGYTFTFPAWIYPSEGGGIGLGSTTERIDSYNGGSGPANFGMGGGTAGSGSGDPVAGGFGSIDVPTGYSSGTQLSDNATWANASFASLGVTPGTYVWTWGTGADQSYTLDIADAPVGVPEPASLGMFGLGVLLLGAFVERRRRMV